MTTPDFPDNGTTTPCTPETPDPGLATREPSGAQWVHRIPGSRATQDLAPSFRTAVEAFLAALDVLVIVFVLREYRLLKTLLTRRGRVSSRDELMTQAWEDPGASLDRTVDAHIKTLRAKLREVDPEADPIRTQRGLGYSLQVD